MAGNAIDLITGVGGIASNFISQAWANSENERLVDKRNRQAIEQWERENAYNAPINQLMRLKAAGLNPNLMYENGAGSLLSASSPDMAAAQKTAPQFDPLTIAQIRKLDAETDNIDANTKVQQSQVPINEQIVLEKKQAIRESEERINEIVANIRNLDEDSKKKEAERINIKFDQVMRGKEWRDSHNKVNAEIRRMNAGSQLDERQFEEMTKTFIYRLTGLKLDNKLTEQQINHYTKLMDKLGIEITQGKQALMINMPQYYQGKEVWRMHNTNRVDDKVASYLYDGIGSFLTLAKGFLKF